MITLSRPLRSGFTLVELLTVIAIASMLAAILFPAFSRVRDNARSTSCQSNLKQINAGLLQYVRDNDDQFPGSEMGGVAWPVLIYPYIKNGQVFVCPSPIAGESFTVESYIHGGDNQSTYFGTTTAGLPGGGSGTVQSLSYSKNSITEDQWSTAAPGGAVRNGFVGAGSTNPNSAMHEAQLEDASGTIMLVDGMASSNDGSVMLSITQEAATDHFSNAQNTKTAYRHRTGFNALYGDGHVKWRPYGTTSYGEWTVQAND